MAGHELGCDARAGLADGRGRKGHKGRKGIVALVVVAFAGAVACAPAPLPVRPAEVSVIAGTTSSTEVAFPEFDHVVEIDPLTPAAGGVTVAVDIAGRLPASPPAVIASATADVDAASGEPRVVSITGKGCLVPPAPEPDWVCPAPSRQAFTVELTVTVVEPGAAVPDGYAPPEADRWVPAGDGTAALPGEVAIVAVEEAAPEAIGELVAGLGGGLTGADTVLGLYQARFSGGIEEVVSQLAASPLVESAEPVVGEQPAPSSEPADWDDDRQDDDATWHFRQVGLPAGWDRTVGSSSVEMGIVDWGIYPSHSDLQLASYETPWSDNRVAQWRTHPGHGTHVAGTMCLPDGNGGLVGAAQQCTLHGFEILGNRTPYITVDTALSEIRKWLDRHPSIQILNLSGSLLGAHQDRGDCSTTVTADEVRAFKRSIEKMREVLWVVAAGNCRDSSGLYQSASDSLPAAAKDLPNVVAVSATTADTDGGARELAYYSVTDGTLAAPGGEPAKAIWSTLYSGCDARNHPPCGSTWGTGSGTSMAAPLVAGTAGLMLSLDPGLTPAQLKGCLVLGSTTPITGVTIRELYVPAALKCAAPAPGVITDGTVTLGVNQEGDLNAQGFGVRYAPTGHDAVTPGCWCEGWGVSAGAEWGGANRNQGVTNLSMEDDFADTVSKALSQVRMGPLSVHHTYEPSAVPGVYEVTVRIANVSDAPAEDVRYRRVMDWDVPPTTFSEYVSIHTGGASAVLATTDNGFDTVNPLSPAAPILFTGEAQDSGPTDHGALFDFGFGTLGAGQSRTFTLFYGAAADKAAAIQALSSVGAEVYTLGMPSLVFPPDGAPNTFLFGAKDAGGTPVPPTSSTTAAPARTASDHRASPPTGTPGPAPQNTAALPPPN
jgi:subtilisin family serine protease